MIFKNLQERMEYYRSLYDHRLISGMPVLIMVDGHNFSRTVKKRFKRPFDETFMSYMDSVAVKICKEFQGVRFAYTQSDEISFLLRDDENSDPSYNFRLCKLQSLIASEATGEFNRRVIEDLLRTPCSPSDLSAMYQDIPNFTFDCKVWQVPSENDINAWFVYRQNDCIRNSISQVGQFYFSHKELLGLNTDEVKKKLEKEKNISWDNDFRDGMKYGRLIYKEEETRYNNGEPYVRSVWKSHDTFRFSGTDTIKNLI